MTSQAIRLEATVLTLHSHSFGSKVQNILNQQFDNENFQINDLCRALHMSRSNLYRKLRSHFNCTYTELVCHLRVEKAMKLLDTTSFSVSEIAYDTGFRDPSYFVKIFKKYTGLTPGRYRRNGLGIPLGSAQGLL